MRMRNSEKLRDDKNLLEFLNHLMEITQMNIDFMNGTDVPIIISDKYMKEIHQIQELINTFDFIKQ